jgi:hypothetical protein
MGSLDEKGALKGAFDLFQFLKGTAFSSNCCVIKDVVIRVIFIHEDKRIFELENVRARSPGAVQAETTAMVGQRIHYAAIERMIFTIHNEA